MSLNYDGANIGNYVWGMTWVQDLGVLCVSLLLSTPNHAPVQSRDLIKISISYKLKYIL